MKISKYIFLGVSLTMTLFFNNKTFALDLNNLSEQVSILGGNDDDYIKSIIETSDDGILAIGTTISKDIDFEYKGGWDNLMIKYDKNGSKEWIKPLWNSTTSDEVDCAIKTSDGGIISVGGSHSNTLGFENKGNSDAVISKYDKDGNQEWIQGFGGSGNDWFKSVIETSDGCFVAVGHSLSTDAGFSNKGNYDAIIVKFDSEGNQLWAKSWGGKNYDYYKSIIEMNGELIVVGDYNSTDTGYKNNGNYDGIIATYRLDGYLIGCRVVGGAQYDYLESVRRISDGFIVSGRSSSTDIGFTSNGGYDAIIIKYDENRSPIWIKNFGGSSSDEFYDAIETSNGDFIAVGYSTSINSGFEYKGGMDATLVTFDREGNYQQVKSFGGSDRDEFTSVMETKHSEIVAVGFSSSQDAGFENKGYKDAIIVKYKEKDKETIAIERAEETLLEEDLTFARELVNQMPEGELKDSYQSRLNLIIPLILELKNTTANLDLYIKSENMLSMTLDTNSIIFEDFSGVDDIEQLNAINISINSSLPYQINAYLVNPIQDINNSHTMDISILNIKESGESDYKTFTDINDKLILKDNCDANNDIVHGVDIKLKGGIANPKDNYKTVIKFEAEQK